VTRLRTGLSRNRVSISSKNKIFFPFQNCPIQPPIQCVLEAISAGGTQPACEADHSAPTIAEVRNGWSRISIPYIPLCRTLEVTFYERYFRRLLPGVTSRDGKSNKA